MREMFALWRAYAICTPKKPKLRFHSFQKLRSGLCFIVLRFYILFYNCSIGEVRGKRNACWLLYPLCCYSLISHSLPLTSKAPGGALPRRSPHDEPRSYYSFLYFVAGDSAFHLSYKDFRSCPPTSVPRWSIVVSSGSHATARWPLVNPHTEMSCGTR